MVGLFLSLQIFMSPAPIENFTQQNLNFWVNILESPQIELRMNALKVLSDLKSPAAVPNIERLFQSEDARLRYQVAWALGRIPDSSSQTALARQLPKEQDSYVKGEINRSLRLLRDVFERKIDMSGPADEEDIQESFEE
jgi:HEAT repeat protein